MGVRIMGFKVGDKVRITANHSSHKFTTGQEVTLVKEFKIHWVARSVQPENATWYINESEFELIENHEPTPVGKTLQELNVQAGDVVSATDAVFSRHGNFTCTGIVEIGDYLGYRYMNSKVYPKGLFGPENGLWKIISRATIAEPSPPRKMHPDDFVSAVNDFARDNGFGVSKIEFRGCTFNDTCLPFHQYSVD
jgi:hypothetical protein